MQKRRYPKCHYEIEQVQEAKDPEPHRAWAEVQVAVGGVMVFVKAPVETVFA
jgi:hypothetical protein